MSIAAIETIYKGKRFRSRLEVRWAMFFDELGLEWQYEPQQYGCRTAYYVPDFYLPQKKMFVEVKPENMLKFPPKVYLAGRMPKLEWVRVPGEDGDGYGECYDTKKCYRPFNIQVTNAELQKTRMYKWIGGALIEYTGPFTVDCCNHGFYEEPHFTGEDGEDTFRRARSGVEACDVFFAYIDDYECFGTLVEIGWATALRNSGQKKVVLGLSDTIGQRHLSTPVRHGQFNNRTEFWFAGMAADATIIGTREQALKLFEEWLCRQYGPTPREQSLAYELTHLHGDYRLDAPVFVVYGDPYKVYDDDACVGFCETPFRVRLREFGKPRFTPGDIWAAAEHARYNVSFDDAQVRVLHDFNPRPAFRL